MTIRTLHHAPMVRGTGTLYTKLRSSRRTNKNSPNASQKRKKHSSCAPESFSRCPGNRVEEQAIDDALYALRSLRSCFELKDEESSAA
jgi:hypothetical protein